MEQTQAMEAIPSLPPAKKNISKPPHVTSTQHPLWEHAKHSQVSHWSAPAFTVPDMTPSVVCKPRDARTVDFAKIAWCLSPNLKVVSASKGSVSSKIPPQVTTHTIPAHVHVRVHAMHGTRPVLLYWYTGKVLTLWHGPMWQLKVPT